jgi:myo-inositol-1(or 4)-monophosphatase
MASPLDLPALTRSVSDIARRAGALAFPYFRTGKQTSAKLWYKGHSSPVTEADMALDTFLKDQLLTLLPEAGWLSEETADNPERLKRRHVWVVDPIDGTRAFASGHPDWAVSIALVTDGEPVLGVLHAPIHDHLYEATKGGSAKRNGETLVLPGENPRRVRVAGPNPLVDQFERRTETVERLPKVPSLALRLARVADDSIDVALVSTNAQDWDIAAADLILREAGGILTDLAGARPVYNRPEPRHGEMIAVTSRLHPRAIEAMRS